MYVTLTWIIRLIIIIVFFILIFVVLIKLRHDHKLSMIYFLLKSHGTEFEGPLD